MMCWTQSRHGSGWSLWCWQKTLMVVGIDTYHEGGMGLGKRPSVGGMVASINPACTRWYSRVCMQASRQELINGLKVCFTAALRKYHEVNMMALSYFGNWAKVVHPASLYHSLFWVVLFVCLFLYRWCYRESFVSDTVLFVCRSTTLCQRLS